MSRVVLTEKKVQNINASKKRKSNLLEWKDTAAKICRNNGTPYINRGGTNKAGVPAPPGVRL